MTKEAINKQLDEMSGLRNNWDGFGSIPPFPEIVTVAKQLVNSFTEQEIAKMSDLFPNPHGTITFDWENENDEKLSLEIGVVTYSYYLIKRKRKPKFVDNTYLLSSLEQIKADIGQI